MKEKSTTGNDLTTGNISKHMFKFALPILVGLFLNMGYQIINMIWIGNLAGKNAVGAATVSFSISLILVGIITGTTAAVSILVSRYYGANNIQMVRKVIDNSWYLFFTNAALLTAVVIVFRRNLLIMLNTPSELLDTASSYLAITQISFFMSYIYEIMKSSLAGMGDTKTPVIFLALTTCINAVLDPFVIKIFGLNGAAGDDVFAWVVAMIVLAIYLKRKKLDISIVPKGIYFDKKVILDILKVGLPTTVKSCLTPISLMFMTAFINGFGADAISAYGAASKIDYLAIMPGAAFGAAASVMTGQNIGAGKSDRVKQVLKSGITLCFSVLLVVAVVIELFPKQILSIFVNDPKVLSMGQDYLRINAIGYCIFSISYITDGFINGHRKTIITMGFSLISLIIIRVPLARLLSGTLLGIRGIWLSMLITYIIQSACGLIYCTKLIKIQKLNSGMKMHTKVVSLDDSTGK